LIRSRKAVPDYAARHSADDRANRPAYNSTRDCAADDSGDGSIAIG
jgi:hypothetical protein